MDGLLACIVFFLSFWVPGFTALSFVGASMPLLMWASVPVGIALWGWQGWIVAWIGQRWLTYPYLGVASIAAILYWKKRRISIRDVLCSLPPFDRLSVLILIIGVVLQSVMVWNVFVPFHGTLAQCCVDGNDTIWYASLTKSVLQSFPPQTPGLSGVLLKNYHYWSQLVSAELVRVFSVPQYAIQFRYIGVLLSVYYGIIFSMFLFQYRKDQRSIRWLLFFLYFGGDLLFLIVLFVHHMYGFPGSSLEDGVRFLGNPPRSMAVVVALVWILLWSNWRTSMNKKRVLLLSLIASSVVGFKIYVGFFLFVGLFFVSIVNLYKKQYADMRLLVACGIAAACVYLPVNAQAGGLYYTGFWRFDNFIVQPGLSLERIELARKIFEADNKVGKVLVFEWFYVGLYVFTIFGTKLIGLFQSKKSWKAVPWEIHLFFLSSFIVNFILGGFYQQSTGGSNTFNFLVNIYLFMTWYTAIGADTIVMVFRPLWWRVSIALVLIVLTVPRAIDVTGLLLYYTTHLTPMVDADTREVLRYLALTPKTARIAVKSTFLSKDAIGPFVYFFSDRPQYLAAPSFLNQFGADTFDRERNLDILTRIGTPSAQRKIVKREQIEYLLLDSDVGERVATASFYGFYPVVKTKTMSLYKIE